MSVSTSSSYVAYLRDVAHKTNSAIARPSPATTRHPQPSTHREKHTKNSAEPCESAESSESSYEYAYDYLREPPVGAIRARSGVGAARARVSAVRLQPTAPAPHSTTTHRNANVNSAITDPQRRQAQAAPVCSLQTSFEQMYASLKEAGVREMEAVTAAAATTTTKQSRSCGYPPAPSCPPHSLSKTRETARRGSRSGRSVQFSKHAEASSEELALSQACFQHSWHNASLAVRVPPMLADDEERRGNSEKNKAKRHTKTAVSTDTSALSSSPTKLTSSSVSSSSSSSSTSHVAADVCAEPREWTGPAHHHHHHHPHHRQRARSPATFTCPNCCRRCDSCRCVGRPCQFRGSRSGSAAHRGRFDTARIPSPSLSSPTRCFSAPRKCTPQSARTSPPTDTVRLRWPNQPEVHTSPLRAPALIAAPAAARVATSPVPTRKAEAVRRHQHHRADTMERTTATTKTSATTATVSAADVQEKEMVLRGIAERTCTCYWSDFPDLTMAVNPSSHAASCPYQVHQPLYEELMAAVEKAEEGEQQRGSGTTQRQLTSHTQSTVGVDASRSSSTSTYSVDSAAARTPSSQAQKPKAAAQRKELTGEKKQDAAQPASAPSADQPARRAMTHQEELAHLQRQRRRWLAEEDAAAKKKKGQGRAAVMGSTQRRTYMEILMAAACDAPTAAPTSTAAKTTARPVKAKASPSPTQVVEVSATTPPPAPPPPLVPQTARSAAEQEGDATEVQEDAHAEGESPHGDETMGAKVTEAEEDAPEQTAEAVVVEATVEEPEEEEEENVAQPPADPLRSLSQPRRRPSVGVPGPGAYHADVAYTWSSAMHAVRGTAMPKAARMPPIKSITPGPGAYHVWGEEPTKEEPADEKPTQKLREGAAGEETGEDGDATVPPMQPNTIGKGVVFNSTSARQLQLQFGASFQHNATWEKTAAALPGPGAYNIIDGDRIDQSRPLGVAKHGFQFAKSMEGGHFSGVVTEASYAAAAAAAAAQESDETASPSAAKKTKEKTQPAVALVVPWRDWARGAYIGTSTTAFFAHPSLSGGGRRTLPRRTDERREDDLDTVAEKRLMGAAGEDAIAREAARNTGGGVWHGVGSGVAFRLTSLRFPPPPASPSPPPPSSPSAKDEAAGAAPESEEARLAALRLSRGEPGPASYETQAALKHIQRRAPEVSMTFKHDRGPRGPLASNTAMTITADGERYADLPGPGTYDVQPSSLWGPRRSPQWVFGTAAARTAIGSSSPFPTTAKRGDNSDNNDDGLSNTLGFGEVEETYPGPGAYNTESALRAVQHSAARATIGAAARFPDLPMSQDAARGGGDGAGCGGGAVMEGGSLVGPGTYDVAAGYAALHGRVKGGALPRAGADVTGDESTFHDARALPGPGSYSLPTLPPAGPTAFLGMKAPRFPWERLELEEEGGIGDNGCGAFSLATSHVTPGPGAYDVEAAAHLARRPGVLIGTAPRTSFLLYPTSSSSSTAAAGIAGGVYSGSTSCEVGPGAYTLPALPTGRSVTFPPPAAVPARIPLLSDRDVPGPGLYDPVDVQSPSARSFSLARTSARFPDAAAATAAAGGVQSATGLYASSQGGAMDSVPGPGAYDVQLPQSLYSGRGAAFGTSARFAHGDGGSSSNDWATRDDAVFDGHRSSSGGGGGGHAASLVGPGSYDPYGMDEKNARSFTFARGARFASPDADDLNARETGSGVGPGTYEVVNLSPPGRSAVMGSAVARPHTVTGNPSLYGEGHSAAPGPGAYDPQYAQVERSVPQVVLATTHSAAGGPRNGAVEGSGLGPGQYDPQYPSQRTQGYSFGSAPRPTTAAGVSSSAGGGRGEVPGPGAYEVRLTRDGQPLSAAGQTGGLVFGTADARAGAAAGSDAPGPGAYMPEAYTDMGSGLGLASRMGTAQRQLWSDAEARRGDGPGPGAYMPEAFTDMGATSVGAPRIGTAPRDIAQHDGSGAAAGPGPGAYEPNMNSALPSATSATFSRAAGHPTAQEVRGADTPGPGAYALDGSSGAPRHADRAAAAAFGSAARFLPDATSQEANGSATPGPNAYSPNDGAVRAAAPAFRFGSATAHVDGTTSGAIIRLGDGERGNAAPDVLPGPGAYDVQRPDLVEAGAHRFGSAPRFEQLASVTADGDGAGAAGGVGPGAYEVLRGLARSSQLPTAASYSFARAPAHMAAGQVGDATSPAGGRMPGVDAERGPGPGAYSLDAAYLATLPRAAVTTFAAPAGPSERERGRFENGENSGNTDAMPGPGAYQLPPAFPEGPQWGFGTAPKATADNHGTNWADNKALHLSNSSHRMSGQVGPGSYDVPSPPPLHGGITVPRAGAGERTHNAHSFPSTPYPGAGEASPGPGAYDVSTAYGRTSGVASVAGVRIGTAPRYAGSEDAGGDGIGAQQNARKDGVRGGPGPGAYSPNVEASSTATGTAAGPTFGHAPRLPFSDDGTGVSRRDVAASGEAGPGSYDVASALARTTPSPATYRFGTAPRMGPDNNADSNGAPDVSVGPGSYVIDRADNQVWPRAPAHRISPAHANGSSVSAVLPGPGSYDVPVEVQAHARAALMLGRNPDPLDDAASAARQHTPGPGAYEAAHTLNATAAHRFGTAPTNRHPLDEQSSLSNAGPGPGAYDSAAAFLATQTNGQHNAFTFGGRPVDYATERRSDAPGPGAYDVSAATALNGVSEPSYSFGTAVRMPEASANAQSSGGGVGPGAYDVMRSDGVGQRGAAPSISFPLAPRTHVSGVEDNQIMGWRDGASTPGPGSYDVAAAYAHASTTPGAGAGGAGGVTIPRGPRPALRAGDPAASPSVGPGSYNPADPAHRAPAATTRIGTAPRPMHAEMNGGGAASTPGPGSYDVQRYSALAENRNGATSFGTSLRPDVVGGQRDTPGPGAYATDAGSTLGAAGPSFGTSERPDVALGSRLGNPGPGTYDAMATPHVASAPRVVFGSAARPCAENADFHRDYAEGQAAAPGPGAYDVAASLFAGREGPRFGASSRPDVVRNTNPGPGSYDSTTWTMAGASAGGASITFPSAARAGPTVSDTPGPGAYHLSSFSPAGGADDYAAAARGFVTSFGAGERFSPPRSTTPGPGAYDRERYVAQLSDGPSFGKAERSGLTSVQGFRGGPGPGAYYRPPPADTYPSTFALAERPSAVLNHNPGPGTYYKDSYLTAGVDVSEGTTMGFGRAERPDPVRNDYPGPGAYHRERDFAAGSSGVGFGRSERPSPVHNDYPGPGTYYREDLTLFSSAATTAAEARKDPRIGSSGMGVSIGTSERPDPTLNDNPGPGTYFRGVPPSPSSPHPPRQQQQKKATKRLTAADTLRKLASVGYPVEAASSAET